MNVYRGIVPRSEPNFDFMFIILHLAATFILPVLAKKGTFDTGSVASSFVEDNCDSLYITNVRVIYAPLHVYPYCFLVSVPEVSCIWIIFSQLQF